MSQLIGSEAHSTIQFLTIFGIDYKMSMVRVDGFHGFISGLKWQQYQPAWEQTHARHMYLHSSIIHESLELPSREGRRVHGLPRGRPPQLAPPLSPPWASRRRAAWACRCAKPPLHPPCTNVTAAPIARQAQLPQYHHNGNTSSEHLSSYCHVWASWPWRHAELPMADW